MPALDLTRTSVELTADLVDVFSVSGSETELADLVEQALRPLPQLIAELERSTIQSALAATGGNKVSAAKLLGISRATLYEKLATQK